jgi:hypothetical protein
LFQELNNVSASPDWIAVVGWALNKAKAQSRDRTDKIAMSDGWIEANKLDLGVLINVIKARDHNQFCKIPPVLLL